MPYLTNRLLVKEEGIILKRFVSVFLEEIEDISCGNGTLGRIFDSGELEIESAGVHETIVFKVIVSVKKRKLRIVREVTRLRK
jgi:hypothetical protein